MKKLLSKESRAIFGFSFGHFNVDLYAAILVPLYPMITSKLGINLASISTIIAIGHLVSSMMQPLFGYISDKLHHRVFMVWGLILTSVFIPLTIKTNTQVLFLLCLMTGMVGNALFHPQVSALVKEFNKNNPELSRYMGIFLGLGTIGYAIGPYLSTLMVENFGLNSLLYLSLLGILSSVFIYFFTPKIPYFDAKNKENFTKVLREIFKNKKCIYLTIISIIKSAVSISFGTYIPFLLKTKGFSLETIGLVVTLFFVSGGLATIFSSKFEKRLSTNGVVVLSFMSVLPLVLLFLYFLNINKYFACILFILTGFFILLSVGIILVEAQKAIPKYTGVVSGLMQGASWGFGALFLSPLGVIGQVFGVDKILIIMAFIAFIAGLYSLKYKYLNE